MKFKEDIRDDYISLGRSEAQYFASLLSMLITGLIVSILITKEMIGFDYVATVALCGLLGNYSIYALLKGRRTKFLLSTNRFTFYEYGFWGPRFASGRIDQILSLHIYTQGQVNGVERGMVTFAHICAVNFRNKALPIYCTATQDEIREFSEKLSRRLGVRVIDETDSASGTAGSGQSLAGR